MRPHWDEAGRMMRGARHEVQTGNWGGYFVAQYQTGRSYSSAQGSWTVPSVSYSGPVTRTSGTQYSSTWVGIGGSCTSAACSGAGDQTLIQLGTEQDISRFGATNYYAWYEMLPANSVTIPYPVAPGDRINASLQCTANCGGGTQSWTLAMSDDTKGWNWSQTFSYASPMLSAEWIEEATSICTGTSSSTCTVQPLPNFGTMTLNPGTANGTNPFLNLAQNGIQMQEENSPQTVQPSMPSAGDGFTVCWGYKGFTPCSFIAGSSPILASVLPSSRSVEIGKAATAFATIINSGSTTAQNCAIALGTDIGGSFSYQTTSSATNAPTGSPNTPVDIPPNGVQSFVISPTPGTTLNGSDTDLQFNCPNVGMAPIESGLDTLLLSASATPTPDVIALSATPSADGILDIPGTVGTGAFAVATTNVGSSSAGVMTASVNTGSATLPLTFTICETDPSTGQCLSTPSTSVPISMPANATPTFSIFASANGAVAFDPAGSRIFVQFADNAGNIRGSTSVAVRTQ